MAYLKAKNAAMSSPGRAMRIDIPARNDRKIAKTPQLSEAVMSIKIADFVAANLPKVITFGIKVIF
jgi:hypothetical protein